MKRILALVFVLAMLAGVLAGCGDGKNTRVLNVYNWGEYISDGSEGSFNTVKEFEKWYKETYGTKVKVNYETFASCEDMYAKISTGAVSYDVIIPSDYMIARMIKEGMLVPLNFENIPNYKNVDESFRGLYYDEEDKYTVPYVFGTIGIIYNANVVDAADVTGWDLMWNPKYSGSILQYNNPRDAFGTAMYRLGIDVNTTDKAEWQRAYDALMEQRPLRYGLVMDEIYNYLESGEAAIGSYYVGDYFTMLDDEAENVDLQFCAPEVTNYYVDAMCIPTCCKDQELAEIFINYMLSPEVAIANAIYTSCPSPFSVVYNDAGYQEEMGEDAMKVLYPDVKDFSEMYNKYAYRNLDNEMLDYINTLWEQVKLN